MGVHGLTSFVKKNISGFYVDLPAQREREPIALVVDGLAFIYHIGLIDPLRGGNYTALRLNVRRHILYWRACGLDPEFVWDGPFDSNKLPTVISRSHQSLARSIAYMRATDAVRATPAMRQNASRLPALTHMAVSAELEELGVESHCAEEEGDSPTAELAQRRNAFVVSNDSDYFIYPARCRGYVPLASIEYSSSNFPRLEGVSPASAPSMRLRVYRHEEIARALALPPHLLPIFAALVGNDLADYASELTLPRAARARPLYPGQVDPAEIRRIAAAVASCAGMAASTLAQIQDVVFAVLPLLLQRPSQDPMIMSVLARSAFGYTLRPLETPSSSFPLHPLPTDSPSAVKARSLYRLAYTRSHLSSFHLHVLKHGVVMCQGSVEQPEFTSPMVTLGRPVRTWIYSILQDAFGALPHGSTVTEYVRRGDELYAAPVEVPLLSQLVTASASPFALASTSPILLSPQPTRFSLFLTALSFPVPLAPPPSSPLFPLFPIVLALRHIQRSHAAKRPWTPHELLSALTVAVLLRLDPLALSAFVQSARLPATPPRDAIQRSVELVQTLVVVNLLAQSLLLCPGQIDAQGVLGGVPPPFLSFDGAGLHALMGMGQGIERVLGGMSDEVLGMVKALEALVAVV